MLRREIQTRTADRQQRAELPASDLTVDLELAWRSSKLPVSNIVSDILSPN